MTAVRPLCAAACAFALLTAAPAQQPTASTTLHSAWLCEVLDLDVPRAIAGYQQVASDARPGHLQRWVAAARLAELHRLRAGAIELPDHGEAPAALRPLFQAAANELPADELLLRVRGEPKTVLHLLSSEAGRLPPLRTVVPGSVDWVMAQSGPSLRDRWRQRVVAFNNRGRGETGNLTERVYAADIVRAELQGRTEQAEALRALYFADWQPPAVDGDAGARLTEVRARLASMRAVDTLPSSQETLLRELAEAIEQRAATDPMAALLFVQRLPIYAERLLIADRTGR